MCVIGTQQELRHGRGQTGALHRGAKPLPNRTRGPQGEHFLLLSFPVFSLLLELPVNQHQPGVSMQELGYCSL